MYFCWVNKTFELELEPCTVFISLCLVLNMMLFVCLPPHPSLPLTKAPDTAPQSWVLLTSPTNRMPGRLTKAVQAPSRQTLDALAVFG